MVSKNEYASNYIKKHMEEYASVAQTIYDFAELGNKEYQSSRYLADLLRKKNFHVEYPYAGMNTAIRAEYGSGHPKVAFLAEYDALPGFGKDHNENVHACGHHLIAANCYGTCCVLADMLQPFDGTIVFIGCPAEETTGGKVDLVNYGCFDDIDVAVQLHPVGGTNTYLANKTLAIDSLEFVFKGHASHAASNPESGINALDACTLTFDGINALRQHVSSDSRIHGIIVHGGTAPNIVPEYTSMRWMVRSQDRKNLEKLTQRVINCAKGAALMTGCELTWRYCENSFDNMLIQPFLISSLREACKEADVNDVISDSVLSCSSTDVGNVSHICPTIMANMGLGNTDGADVHEEAFLDHLTSSYGMNSLQKAIQVQVYFALKILTDKRLQECIYTEKAKLINPNDKSSSAK